MAEIPENRSQPIPLPISRVSSSDVPKPDPIDIQLARPTSENEDLDRNGSDSEKVIHTSVITDRSSKSELPSTSSLPDEHQESAPPASLTKHEAFSTPPDYETDTQEPGTEAKLSTEEETMQQDTDDILQYWKILLAHFASVPMYNKDGSFTEKFLFALEQIDQFHFEFDEYSHDILEALRKNAGEHLANSGLVSKLCDIIVQGLKAADYKSEESSTKDLSFSALRYASSTLMNFTDSCRDVVLIVIQHASLLATLLEKLKEWSESYLDGSLNIIDSEFMVEYTLTLLHNVSMHDESIPKLRDLNTTEVLLPYLKSSSEEIKFITVSILAEVMTEKEADDLATSPDVVRFMLLQLEIAFLDKHHRHNGFSVQELVRAVRQLARNDANKRLLVEEEALPLLTKGIQCTHLQERNECLEAIWVLSFNKENIEDIMKDEDLLDTVVRLYRDQMTPESSQKLSQGILWQLRNELEKSKKFGNVGKQLLEITAHQRYPKGHVMLSYQWADQEVVKRVCDYLKKEGFRVWIDLENMEGSILQAMAEAVEQATVVISCMSQRYKDSPNCRAEAEYAFSLRKNIVPLIMQQGYKPDGWLGLILGAKLYYDVSEESRFQDRVGKLVMALRNVSTGNQEIDTVDGPTQDCTRLQSEKPYDPTRSKPTAESTSGLFSCRTVTNEITRKLQTWTSVEIRAWLKKFDLAGPELESLTGTELVFLDKIHGEAPEFFYNVLERKLQIQTLSGLKKFMDAMEALPSML